jgi:hypothetical protein
MQESLLAQRAWNKLHETLLQRASYPKHTPGGLLESTSLDGLRNQ